MDTGCFHVLAVVCSGAMNIVVHISFWIRGFIFLIYVSKSGIMGHMVTLFLVFKEPPYSSPYQLYQFTFPSQCREGSLFCTPSLALIKCRIFNDGHSDWCEVTTRCRFDFNFSNNWWYWAYFHMSVGHLYTFLEEYLFRSSTYFVIGLCLFVLHWTVYIVCIFEN